MNERYSIFYQSSQDVAEKLGYVHAPDLSPEIHLALENSDRWYSEEVRETSFHFDKDLNSITLTKVPARGEMVRHTITATLRSVDPASLEMLAQEFGLPFDEKAVIMPKNKNS